MPGLPATQCRFCDRPARVLAAQTDDEWETCTWVPCCADHYDASWWDDTDIGPEYIAQLVLPIPHDPVADLTTAQIERGLRCGTR